MKINTNVKKLKNFDRLTLWHFKSSFHNHTVTQSSGTKVLVHISRINQRWQTNIVATHQNHKTYLKFLT